MDKRHEMIGNPDNQPINSRKMPAAKKEGHANHAGGNHSGIFAQEEKRESHGAVFGVVSADQFLLGFGHVERSAIRLGMDADQKQDKRERLRENVPRQRMEWACLLTMSSRFSVPKTRTTQSTASPSGIS